MSARLMLGVVAVGVLVMLAVPQNPTTDRQYVDPGGRFEFTYPASFGAPSQGTDDGFRDRVAAIRFSTFSTRAIGGEAALTRGFPLIDLQAVGGLYDDITLAIFTDPIRLKILQVLKPLDASNFCAEIARESHLDPEIPALQPLTPQQKAAIPMVDRMRNVNPRVLRCTLDGGDVVTFDKDVAFQEGSPRQHVYGAIRFLTGDYSTFQIVRAGAPPDAGLLDEITAVAKSFRRR